MRRELPEFFARWKADKHDLSVSKEVRDELNRLDHPETVVLATQDSREPEVDEAFHALGIVN